MPAPHGAQPPTHPVVLFDGDCAFCSASVRFIIRRDPRARFRFAPLHSPSATRLLAEHDAPTPLPDSLILLDANALHVRSDAALRIVRRLRFPWPLLSILVSVPRAWRDAIYDAIARRRKHILSAQPRCEVPTPDVARRFLEQPPASPRAPATAAHRDVLPPPIQ